LKQIENKQIELSCICISGLGPTVIPVNKLGKPLYPAILWLDSRAIEEEEWLKNNIGEEKIFNITKNVTSSYYGLVKILWLKNKKKEIYDRTYKFLNVKDYILYKLTGNFLTDYTHASCTAIGFNMNKKKWDEGIFKLIGIDIKKMPEPTYSENIIGVISSTAAEETYLTEGTPVNAGILDGIGNFVSAGVTEEGESVISLGTSTVWSVVSSIRNYAKKMFNTFSADPNINLTLSTIAFSGGIYKWLRENIFKKYSEEFYKIMDKEASEVSPGSEGLITIPYLIGEKTPIWDPNARGVLFGLSHIHGRGHVFRSSIEGAAFALLDNQRNMEKYNIKINKSIYVTGGGAKSKIVRETLSSMLNKEIIYLGGNISAEFGDAYIAAKSIGMLHDYKSIQDNLFIKDVTKPNEELHYLYNTIYREVYKNIYSKLKSLFLKNKQIQNNFRE
jgi:ribulokinase